MSLAQYCYDCLKLILDKRPTGHIARQNINRHYFKKIKAANSTGKYMYKSLSCLKVMFFLYSYVDNDWVSLALYFKMYQTEVFKCSS